MLGALWYNIQLKIKKKQNSLKENRNENLNYKLRTSALSHDLPLLQKI